jgi:hypothetical protein
MKSTRGWRNNSCARALLFSVDFQFANAKFYALTRGSLVKMSGLQAWEFENRGSIPGKGKGVSSFLHRVRIGCGTHRLSYQVEYGERGGTLTIHLHEQFLNSEQPFLSFQFIAVYIGCIKLCFLLLQVSKGALLGAILPAYGNVQPYLVPFDLPVVTYSLAWCHSTAHGNVQPCLVPFYLPVVTFSLAWHHFTCLL